MKLIECFFPGPAVCLCCSSATRLLPLPSHCSRVSPLSLPIDRLLLVTRWIPTDDCGEPAALWPSANPVYILLTDSHSNLPEQTSPSCTAWNLWKKHQGDGFRHVLDFQIYTYKYLLDSCFFLAFFFFAAVPPCDSHRRSTETKIETSLRHTSGWRHWAPASLFFARRSAAGACQEMNSRLIQALNVLQMTTS